MATAPPFAENFEGGTAGDFIDETNTSFFDVSDDGDKFSAAAAFEGSLGAGDVGGYATYYTLDWDPVAPYDGDNVIAAWFKIQDPGGASAANEYFDVATRNADGSNDFITHSIQYATDGSIAGGHNSRLIYAGPGSGGARSSHIEFDAPLDAWFKISITIHDDSTFDLLVEDDSMATLHSSTVVAHLVGNLFTTAAITSDDGTPDNSRVMVDNVGVNSEDFGGGGGGGGGDPLPIVLA